MLDIAAAFCLLRAAEGQPRRGHHRLGRQRGVDGRHPVGARPRAAGSRGRHPAARSWRCCPPTPRRRTRSTRPRRRSARSATPRSSRWCRESQRIDTILLIGSLANEATAAKRAEELAAITAETEQPILLSTYTTATPGAMARFRRGRHPLLHLDAELRPRDPRAGRLRRFQTAAAPPIGGCRRPRRRCATRSAARWQSPARC